MNSTTDEGTLLDNLLEPFGECLTPEVARKLVNLHATSAIASCSFVRLACQPWYPASL